MMDTYFSSLLGEDFRRIDVWKVGSTDWVKVVIVGRKKVYSRYENKKTGRITNVKLTDLWRPLRS